MEHCKQSFEPLICEDIQVLILGSIPGDRSIELQQYYGHPQNRFWRVIAAITESELPIDYQGKKQMLANAKIGLWDVARRAIRKGSLDSAMREEEPNAIDELVKSCPSLKVIAFNGQKAEKLYDRYFQRAEGVRYLSMPSTSPANAVMGLEGLCGVWGEVYSADVNLF